MAKPIRNWLDNKWKVIGKSPTTHCEICGKPNSQYQIHAHHVIGRSHSATRWDIANRIWVCARCHTLDQKQGVEYNLGGWFLNWESDFDWMGKNRPEDKKYLFKVHKVSKKWSNLELEELKTAYKEAIKNPIKVNYLKYLIDV